MLFVVIENYRHGPGPVYERAAQRGRMLPAGLRYIDSWVVDDGQLGRCFQLMEADDPSRPPPSASRRCSPARTARPRASASPSSSAART